MAIFNVKPLLISLTTLAAMGLSTSTLAQASVTVKQCRAIAKTEMENTYCDVLEKSGPSALPNFYQFRQNPGKMQLLLLKSPARKAGVDLPDEKAAKHNANLLKPTPVIEATPEATPTPQRPSAEREDLPELKMPSASQVASGLENCELDNTIIHCETTDYQLVTNLMLEELDARALTEHNQLMLPLRQGNDTTTQYLSKIYPLYVEKMLRLGLGGATMSFTKFHSMFHETVKQGLSFTERFNEMYELLKKERKTQAIQRRYNDRFPESIAACMRLNGELIACDNVKQNWIYQKVN